MLKQLRDSLGKIVGFFVLALIVLAFAFAEVPGLSDFAQGAALKVGKVGFSQQDIEEEFNRQVTARRLQSGGDYDRATAIAQGLPTQIISTLATRSALQQEARRLGLAMPRDVVSAALQSDERYQNPRTGKFDLEALDGILRQYNISAAEFEQIMREDLLRSQLVDAAAAGPGAPRAVVQAILLREVEERTVSYVAVTEEMTGIPEEPTPDALKTYYEQNAPLFTAPEYRTLTAVILRDADFRAGLSAPEEELRRLYDLNRARLYDKPERRTIYQTTFDARADAEAAAAALRDGGAFEEIARERGLTLDAVTFSDIAKADILDPRVAEAAFDPARGENDVAGPIEGLFGHTVVQIAAVTPPETRTFEDVRGEIEEEVLANDTRKKVFDAVEAIEDARDTGASLAEAARGADLEPVTFGPLDRFSFAPGGAIIDGVPGEVIEEAFSLEEGDESVERELADKAGYFFVAVDAVTPPAVTPFDLAEPEVTERWRADERARRLREAVRQIREALDGGAGLAEAAAPFDRAPTSLTLTRRQDALGEFSPALVEQIFAAGVGDPVSGPMSGGDDGAPAPQAVVVVDAVSYNEARINPAQEGALGQYVGFQLDQELLDAYATALRTDLGVTTKADVIDELFADVR